MSSNCVNDIHVNLHNFGCFDIFCLYSFILLEVPGKGTEKCFCESYGGFVVEFCV